MAKESLITKQSKKTKTSFKIRGITYKTPDPPAYKDVPGVEKKVTDQVLSLDEMPDFMNKVSRKDGKIVWTAEQNAWMSPEYDRCKKDGYWFMCCGEVTYITPLHYFYLKYYTLEDGTRPEYRDCDRRWFYFLDWCLKKGYIKGIVRLKKRREGATSQTCCWILWTALFFPNSKSGIVSKTEEDAQSAYTDMVLNAWNNLHPFLKPEHDRYTSKKINLSKQTKKKKEVEDGEEYVIQAAASGMNSSIAYRSTTLTAFDSGRLTALLIDESTKWDTVNILEYLPKVMKTMMQGARRVGFCVLPSSMNQLDKGGDNFRKLYKASNQFANEEAKEIKTETGLYTYFVPAFDGFPGFIGKYGESIIDKPTRSQLKWLQSTLSEDMDITQDEIVLGAKAYLEKRRAALTDPTLLAEERRSNPFSEDEVLYDGDKNCYFPAQLLTKQMIAIDNEKKYIRTGRFYPDEKGIIHFADDPAGMWHVLEMPPIGIQNTHIDQNGVPRPMFPNQHKTGVDPYRQNYLSLGVKGSNGCIVVVKEFNAVDPEEGGYPVAFFRGRPKQKKNFYKEVEMGTKFWSNKACIESDIDDFYQYFWEKGLLNYCRHTPGSVIDPKLDLKAKDHKRKMWGVKSADPFAFNRELELAQLFVENHIHKIWFKEILQDMFDYDHENRTKSDLTIAFMMALCDMASYNVVTSAPVVCPITLPTYDLTKKDYSLS